MLMISNYRYDLAHGERVEYPLRTDRAALQLAAGRLSAALLKPCLGISVGEGNEKPSLAALDVDSALPRWSPKRGFYTELTLGIMRSYVEGLKTCDLEVPGLPPSLADIRAPAAFEELARKLPRFKVLGWSLVPAEATEAVELAFSRHGKRTVHAPAP